MDVAQVLPEYADVFPFDEFNEMQREAVPALLERDDNVVASAPTASGKTALAELAICRALAAGGTALFIAPLRALTTEKEREWDRFGALDHAVYVVTGERDLNPRRARRADILVMTPEKLDSATRKADSRRYDFVTDVDLCVIDEVHLLDAERRGSALEVTVSRLRAQCDPRIVALSATLPNVEDVAAWLDAPPACTFSFGQEYRPVDLHAEAVSYRPGENAFADKYRRLYRALDLVEPHLRDAGQALVFVASRRDAVTAAQRASEELDDRGVDVGGRGDYDLHQRTTALDSETLREVVLDGVAFHHAGLSRGDRELVESLFREGAIAALFSTSTLAWGVNLPARCVVLRDTKRHDPLEGTVDVSHLDVLQMLGRAGRPGYDDVGYGWVICPPEETGKYRRLLEDGTPIESRLADHLEEHLNAEIALGTVEHVDGVQEWLEGTYFYARGQRRPADYGFTEIDRRVRTALETLEDGGFVSIDGDGSIAATRQGTLASRYYLQLETALRFADRAGGDGLARRAILETVAGAEEFAGVSTRTAERDAIEHCLRAEPPASFTSGQRKVLAIMVGTIRGDLPSALASDAWIIAQNATRLIAALRAFLAADAGRHAANRARRLEAAVEYGVPPEVAGVTAIDGVGSGRASKLAAEGITTPQGVTDRSVEWFTERGFSRGVAERLIAAAAEVPTVEIEWGEFPTAVRRGERTLREVTIRAVGPSAPVGVRVTVNGTRMLRREAYLREQLCVPVAVYGAAESPLEYEVSVAVPTVPIDPVSSVRTVTVDG